LFFTLSSFAGVGDEAGGTLGAVAAGDDSETGGVGRGTIRLGTVGVGADVSAAGGVATGG
jgi:hypothetical protein